MENGADVSIENDAGKIPANLVQAMYPACAEALGSAAPAQA
jgi:hypothetical protein